MTLAKRLEALRKAGEEMANASIYYSKIQASAPNKHDGATNADMAAYWRVRVKAKELLMIATAEWKNEVERQRWIGTDMTGQPR